MWRTARGDRCATTAVMLTTPTGGAHIAELAYELGFAPDDPRPKYGDRARDIEGYLRRPPSSEPTATAKFPFSILPAFRIVKEC